MSDDAGRPAGGDEAPAERRPAAEAGDGALSAVSPAGEEHDDRGALSGVASAIAGAAGPAISAALRPVGELTSGARRAFETRSGARVRRIRRMGRQALPNLWEVHPEAHRAAMRELGLSTVPVDLVAGTAVEGTTQRGGDFLPLRQLRGRDWRARWQRILSALDRLVSLPPVDLIKFGDRYWVVDGHNRVAAALYTGQVEMDANVIELRLPGMRPAGVPANLAPYLDASRDLRAAGSGRLTRTTARPEAMFAEHPLDEHADDENAPPMHRRGQRPPAGPAAEE